MSCCLAHRAPIAGKVPFGPPCAQGQPVLGCWRWPQCPRHEIPPCPTESCSRCQLPRGHHTPRACHHPQCLCGRLQRALSNPWAILCHSTTPVQMRNLTTANSSDVLVESKKQPQLAAFLCVCVLLEFLCTQ